MKRHLLLFVALFMSAHFLNAQTLQGRAAADRFPGASMLWIKDGHTVPDYIKLEPGQTFAFGGLFDWMQEKLGTSAGLNYRLSREMKDPRLNMLHYRLQQTNFGVPVWDAHFIAHAREGKVESINGRMYKEIIAVNNPALSEARALESALDHIGAAVYKWQMPGEEDLLKREKGNPASSYYPVGELTLFPVDMNKESAGHRYAWAFDVYAHQPMSRREILVDAETGAILFENDRIRHSDSTGTAVTAYSGTHPIITDFFEGQFRLRETTRGDGVETYDMNTGTSYNSSVDFLDDDNNWNNVNAQEDEVATDAHWGAEVTYDYFLIKHGRNSIDDNGFKLRSYVHYDVNYSNAFWDGSRMTYGDGGSNYSPFTALDICGHEVSHGFTEFTSNLIYSYESGAMNEAYSDIFGTLIEWYGKPTLANWLMGEDIGSAFRSMSNPNAYGDPDTYLGTNWYVGSNDNGGVHTNSGVLNFWFYLTAMGGTGTNDNGDVYNVTGIGLDDAGAIAYRTNAFHLIPTSQYIDARFYSIVSAMELFGGCSSQHQTVANAMYAVGIGSAYAPGATVDFEADETSFCKLPGQVIFTNNSNNVVDLLWDFGDGSTSNQINPIHNYLAEGSYTVTLIGDGQSCGSDTMTKVAYINVDVPDAPVVTNASNCGGPASLTLQALAADSVKWFTSPSGGIPFHSGTSYTTPVLSQTTHYYVENQEIQASTFGGKPDNSGGGNIFTANSQHYLVFDAYVPVRIKTVKVYAQGAGMRAIELKNSTGVTLQVSNINIPDGESTIILNMDVPAGNNWRLAGPPGPDLYRNNSGTAYPYTTPGLVQIKHSSATQNPTGYYYYFYNWEVSPQPCISERKIVSAFINAGAPVAGFTYYFSNGGLTVNFQNTSVDGNEFLWDFGDGASSTLENPSHDYAANGTYTVTLTVTNSCGTHSSIQSVSAIFTGIGNNSTQNHLTLSPNPARNTVILSCSAMETSGTLLKVSDVTGREMWSEKISETGTGITRTINIASFSPGVYFVSMENQRGRTVKRLVVE